MKASLIFALRKIMNVIKFFFFLRRKLINEHYTIINKTANE